MHSVEDPSPLDRRLRERGGGVPSAAVGDRQAVETITRATLPCSGGRGGLL
jgi:hypothetical protein